MEWKLRTNKPSIQVKGFDLPWDLPLLAGITLQVAYFTLLLKRHQFGDLVALIENSCNTAGRKQLEVQERLDSTEQAELDKVYRAASFVLRRLLRSKRPCLRRSLVVYRWCCKHGLAADIVIGVKKTGGKLESHAWLLIDEQPYRENLDELAKYSPIIDSRNKG